MCETSVQYPMGYRQNSSSNGEVYFYRTVHTMATAVNRKYQFTAEYNGNTLTVESNAYRVFRELWLIIRILLFTLQTLTDEASRVHVVSTSLGGSIAVNTPFNFTLQTQYEDPPSSGNYTQLTEGPHSQLHIDCYVHYKFKLLQKGRDTGGNFHRIVETNVTLAGADVIENAKFDLMIRKRAVMGEAIFTDIRILDVMEDVQLNFTQTMTLFPWERRPFGYTEQWYAGPVSNTKLLNMTNVVDSPAVAVSHSFDVTRKLLFVEIYCLCYDCLFI